MRGISGVMASSPNDRSSLLVGPVSGGPGNAEKEGWVVAMRRHEE